MRPRPESTAVVVPAEVVQPSVPSPSRFGTQMQPALSIAIDEDGTTSPDDLIRAAVVQPPDVPTVLRELRAQVAA